MTKLAFILPKKRSQDVFALAKGPSHCWPPSRLLAQGDRLPERVPIHDVVFGSLRDAHASLPTDPVLLESGLFPTYRRR